MSCRSILIISVQYSVVDMTITQKASRLEITRTRTVTYGTYCIKNLIAKHWKEIIPKLSVKTNAISKNGLKKHIKYFPPL